MPAFSFSVYTLYQTIQSAVTKIPVEYLPIIMLVILQNLAYVCIENFRPMLNGFFKDF